MPLLTPREQALVSIGAAMGSNCSFCIEHHVPASRKVGLGDAHISEAIRLADKVRQVPASKTLDTAFGLLAQSTPAAPAEKPCCS